MVFKFIRGKEHNVGTDKKYIRPFLSLRSSCFWFSPLASAKKKEDTSLVSPFFFPLLTFFHSSFHLYISLAPRFWENPRNQKNKRRNLRENQNHHKFQSYPFFCFQLPDYLISRKESCQGTLFPTKKVLKNPLFSSNPNFVLCTP